eukprot:1846371-Ditylum_brightwellii.AAC.1
MVVDKMSNELTCCWQQQMADVVMCYATEGGGDFNDGDEVGRFSDDEEEDKERDEVESKKENSNDSEEGEVVDDFVIEEV